MIKKILAVTILVLFSSVAISADLPDSSKLPRMPDSYRNSNYKDMSKRNPYGMSLYDVAERAAEEEYFGAEVVSLEESKRILSERKKQKEKEMLNQGVSK
jgi:hypothetical protein